MGTKKFIKNSKNSFLVEKIQPRSGKARASSIKSVLEDISIYQLRPKENFFLSFKKLQDVTFVVPDPRLLEIGAK